MTVLRVLVRTAVEDRLMERDVTAGIKLAPRQDREMSIATPAQAREIQSAIAAPYRLLVETMFATGVRYGEAMGLRPEDIEGGPDPHPAHPCRGQGQADRPAPGKDARAPACSGLTQFYAVCGGRAVLRGL